MKKLLLLCFTIIAFAFTSKAQTMNCGNFCVLGINNIDTVGSNTLDVTIYNGDASFVDYPVVVLVDSIGGDTIANINNLFYFFGHASMDTLTHTIPTTLDSIPAGFSCIVYYTDSFDSTTCSYSYPMSCTVGINEALIAESSLFIYPNPATTTININLNELDNNSANITIYDAKGRAVKTISTTERTLSIERGDLRSGIYFVRVMIGNKTLTKKIVLE